MKQITRFTTREEAGKLLAHRLKKYQREDVYVFALPRGGVIPALAIAEYLDAPLGLLFTRKIGHPNQPEYAVAAVSESGYLLGNIHELMLLNEGWLEDAIEQAVDENRRRRAKYTKGELGPQATGGIAILVDDGVATGLSLRAGMLEIRDQNPQKIIVAAPVIPEPAFSDIARIADEVVTLRKPIPSEFLGSVGAYYDQYPQVSDEEVISSLISHEKEQMEHDIKKTLVNVARW